MPKSVAHLPSPPFPLWHSHNERDIAVIRQFLYGLLLAVIGVAFSNAQALAPRTQRCVDAAIAVENVARAISNSQKKEAERIVHNSALAPIDIRHIEGLIALWSKQDPKLFTARYIQELSQKHYSQCMSR